MTVLLGVMASAICSFLLVAWLARPHGGLQVLDHPNERSLHARPVPRTGGVGILAGIVAGMLAGAGLGSALWLDLLPAVLVLAAVSFQDDRSHVPATVRLGVHLLCALWLLWRGLAPTTLALPGTVVPLSEAFAMVLAAAFLVWMINLYNFMDGMDGLAGGMAFCGFAAFAWLGRAEPHFFYVSLVIAAAALGFVLHNRPPARIFMGDSGSATLGLLAGALALWADRNALFPLWIALLVFSPFVADSSLTLLRRALRGERIWQAHRDHYYQRMVLMGWGRGRVLVGCYAVMLATAVSAIAAQDAVATVQWAIVAFWSAIFGAGMIWIGRCWRLAGAGR